MSLLPNSNGAAAQPVPVSPTTEVDLDSTGLANAGAISMSSGPANAGARPMDTDPVQPGGTTVDIDTQRSGGSGGSPWAPGRRSPPGFLIYCMRAERITSQQ